MHTPDSASAMEHEHTIDRAHSGSDVQGITQFVTENTQDFQQRIDMLMDGICTEFRVKKIAFDIRINNDKPAGSDSLFGNVKSAVARIVQALESMPGARGYFEKKYQFPNADITDWMEKAGLSVKNSESHLSVLSNTQNLNIPENKGASSVHFPVTETLPVETLPTSPIIAESRMETLVAVQNMEQNEPVSKKENGQNGHALVVDKKHVAVIAPSSTPARKSVNGKAAMEKAKDNKEQEDSAKNIKTILKKLKEPQALSADALPHQDILERIELIIAGDPAMEKIWRKVAKYAKNPDINMFFRGETGSGKELLPKAVHQMGFADKPLVVVNCGAFNPQLIESELFGHEKGAFTDAKEQHIGAFERAKDGVLVLDEIGDLDMPLQVKLLRAIENKIIRRVGGKADVSIGNTKIISTTNRKIHTMVEVGTFREDLFMRIGSAQFILPALRDRELEHKVLLIRSFLKQSQAKRKDTSISIEEDAMMFVAKFSYRGNVREMRSHLEKAYEEAKYRDATTINIQLEDVESALDSCPSAPETISSTSEPGNVLKRIYQNGAISVQRDTTDPDVVWFKVDPTLFEGNGLEVRKVWEKITIFELLRLCGGNQSAVAEKFGITRGKIRDVVNGKRNYDHPPFTKDYLGEQKFVTDSDDE
jgi:DNA-binding NtrC family response regulator